MLKLLNSTASDKCLYSAHLTSDRAQKEEEKGINYSSVSEHIFTCPVINSSVNCFITASINIFNDSDHCHSKMTRNWLHRHPATVSPNANLSVPASNRRCRCSIACPRANRCRGLIGKRRMSQSCSCNAGIVLDRCHKVKHRCPVSLVNAVWRCQEKKCVLCWQLVLMKMHRNI